MSGPRNRLAWALGVAVAVLLVVVGILIGLLLRDGDGTADATSATSGPRGGRSASTTAPSPSDPGSTGRPGSTITTPDGPVAVDDVTVQEGLVQRQYLVYRPADVPADRRLPLVMVLHGLGVDRNAMATTAPWAARVAADDFIAVFPQGVLSSWNLGPCCPPASLANVDDLGFLGRVTDQLRSRSDVDPSRMYLTGFSNGGMMAIELACRRSDDFAAVSPIAATNVTGCAPTRPMSLLQMHGDPDPTVPYDGSPSLSQLLSSKPFPAVPTSVANWAAASGCSPGPDRTDDGDGVRTDRWKGCPQGVEVELVTYPGNGHNWPTEPLDGLDEMLRFFGLAS